MMWLRMKRNVCIDSPVAPSGREEISSHNVRGSTTFWCSHQCTSYDKISGWARPGTTIQNSQRELCKLNHHSQLLMCLDTNTAIVLLQHCKSKGHPVPLSHPIHHEDKATVMTAQSKVDELHALKATPYQHREALVQSKLTLKTGLQDSYPNIHLQKETANASNQYLHNLPSIDFSTIASAPLKSPWITCKFTYPSNKSQACTYPGLTHQKAVKFGQQWML